MEKIKLCIVEDDPEFQDWILEELNEAPRITCLSKHTTGEEALAQIPQLAPDIVIMDLTLKKSEVDGIECMLRLNLVAPDIEFLAITANNNESKILEAIRVGARSYIQKGDIPRKLTELVIELYNGGAPMSPGIARRILEFFGQTTTELELLQKLSVREKEILEQLSRGFLYKEIAENLTIKIGTVKQHAHRIYKKLQVNNRTEAIRKYLNR